MSAAAVVSPKKSKTDEVACVKEDATIPVNTVTRMFHFKVAGEKEAVQAEAVLRKLHNIMKSVDGYQGAHRFVCKEHWDMKYFVRLSGVPALEAYMGSSVKKDQVEPLVKELESIAKDGQVHRQNFVADNWD